MTDFSFALPQPRRHDLGLAVDAAVDAAAAILAVREGARENAKQKSDDSPVTAADLAADALLRARLGADGTTVVSEEAWPSSTMPPSGRVWIVDPIDGTEDFVAGRDDYVVQVGLVEGGVPVVGVVVQPATGTIWRGVVGVGVDVVRGCVARVVDVDGAAALVGAPRVAVSVSHPSALVDFVVGELGGTVVPIGSVGLKIAALLERRVDAYVTGSRRIKVWDTAGPAALCLAGGGVITGLAQRPLRYDAAIAHDDGVCAWSPGARATLLPRLDDALRRFKPAT